MSRSKKALIGVAFVLACLASGWFGFWFGFSEMFFKHLDRQYSSDVAELVTGRRLLRCLEEDPSKGIATLREHVKLRRQMLMLVPQPLEWRDRLQAVADPGVLWPILQQEEDSGLSRAKKAAFVQDESRPATCSGKKASVSSPSASLEEQG
jgi:hypothetical protein